MQTLQFWHESEDFSLFSITYSWARPSSMPKESWNWWTRAPPQQKRTLSHILIFFLSVSLDKTQSSCLDYIHDIHFYGNRSSGPEEKKLQWDFRLIPILKNHVLSALEKLLVVWVLTLIYTFPYHSFGSVCKWWKCCRYLPLSLYTAPGKKQYKS